MAAEFACVSRDVVAHRRCSSSALLYAVYGCQRCELNSHISQLTSSMQTHKQRLYEAEKNEKTKNVVRRNVKQDRCEQEKKKQTIKPKQRNFFLLLCVNFASSYSSLQSIPAVRSAPFQIYYIQFIFFCHTSVFMFM